MSVELELFRVLLEAKELLKDDEVDYRITLLKSLIVYCKEHDEVFLCVSDVERIINL